jgi:predicted deacylase
MLNIVKNLNLDEALSKKNSITKGKINLMTKVDGNSVFIPAIVVCGAEDGPTFLIDACIHGEEYEATEAILQAVPKMDTTKIRGKVIMILAVNMEAFMTGTRGAYHDYYGLNDLNRMFPGREDAFFTQYLASFYKNNVIAKANFYLSYHGGGNYLYLQPEAGYHVFNDEFDETSKGMAKAFGANCIWRNDLSQLSGTNMHGTSREIAHSMGIPSCLAEIGGQSTRFGFRTENVDRLERGIWNIMKYLKMIDGELELADTCYTLNIEYLHCHNGGLHYPQQKPLVPIKKGTTLSIITDVFGNVVEEIKAPYDGMIAGYWAYSLIHPRNHAFLYGAIHEVDHYNK